MIVAIDGPAGSGKSTVAKLLARRLGYLYIDTGAMYRAITLSIIEKGIDIKDEDEIVGLLGKSKIDLKTMPDGNLKIFLDGKDVSFQIRAPRVTAVVSDISKIARVREIMLGLQRDIAKDNKVVMEGRDIGTVVFPNAERKFFLDADFKERSMRRFKELSVQKIEVTPNDIEQDLKKRDRIDSTRDIAPLKRSDDAIYVDTTHLSIDDVVETLLKYIGAK